MLELLISDFILFPVIGQRYSNFIIYVSAFLSWNILTRFSLNGLTILGRLLGLRLLAILFWDLLARLFWNLLSDKWNVVLIEMIHKCIF